VDLTSNRTRLVLAAGAIAGLLALATALIAVLERVGGVSNADAVYLVPVVAAAVAFGTPFAIATAAASFVLYDFFFVNPTLTLSVADPTAWLNLLLLLLVGALVGQLAAMQRNRAEAAEEREREARALFVISRALVSSSEPDDGVREIVTTLASSTRMRSIWVGLGRSPDQERVAASFGPDAGSVTRLHCVLHADPRTGASWIPLHAPLRAPEPPSRPGETTYRVAIRAGDELYGSIWAIRDASAGQPGEGESRLLAVAADQLGRAIERRRLADQAASVEVTRRSEALKSALLDSVSHDLRTPLASIRAAAGSLMDDEMTWTPDEQREAAEMIDREADRLNGLVTNLLDMSRIEAGELVPHPAPFSLDDLVRGCVARRRLQLDPRTVVVDLDPTLPPVLVDGLFAEQVMGNILDNVARHTPADATVRIRDGRPPAPGMVRLVVGDDGPGVPPETLERLFDKFYRVRQVADGARGGTGVGLSVARGLVEVMGGRVTARAAEPHGLEIVVDLPADIGTGASPARGGDVPVGVAASPTGAGTPPAVAGSSPAGAGGGSEAHA
jgi:two-component system sensor histidine kinase KdpD